MSRKNVQVVRALWAGLRQDPGEPWPPASRDELDRRLRLDLCDERIEIRNPAEFPVADEYHGHEGVRQWAAEVWEVFSEVHHELEEIIEVEARQVTACTFGGPDLDRLYITTSRENLEPDDDPLAGSLFTAMPGVTGLPVREYAG